MSGVQDSLDLHLEPCTYWSWHTWTNVKMQPCTLTPSWLMVSKKIVKYMYVYEIQKTYRNTHTHLYCPYLIASGDVYSNSCLCLWSYWILLSLCDKPLWDCFFFFFDFCSIFYTTHLAATETILDFWLATFGCISHFIDAWFWIFMIQSHYKRVCQAMKLEFMCLICELWSIS